eukprot:5646216-Prymnesium_polylepis.1
MVPSISARWSLDVPVVVLVAHGTPPQSNGVQTFRHAVCYAKEYAPRSKTALQGRECRVLGCSATQKAFLLIEVSTGKKVVSPHACTSSGVNFLACGL